MTRDARGFTFIEMLVVVAILSGIAMLAWSTAGEADHQRRHEDTQQRLQIIRRAVLGVTEPAYDGQARLSGFVADNGVLPANLAELVAAPSGFDLYLARQAQFDPDPDAASCLDNTGASNIGDPLFKGWRGGSLPIAPGADRFRDGWGNHSIVSAADDTDNHGWGVPTPVGTMTVTSRGLNNVASLTDTGYDADIALTMDGRVDLNGWQVTIANRHATATLPASGSLRVSVLAYVNTATGGKWKRVTSSQVLTTGIAPGASAVVSFNGLCNNGSTGGDSIIPLGRHLVLLIADSDTTVGDAHNGATESVATGTLAFARQVAFFAGTDRPTVTVDIR